VPPAEARRLAVALAAMIDGLWLRATLSSPNETDSVTARAIASAFIDDAIARAVADGAPAVAELGAAVEAAVALASAAQPVWAAQPGPARGSVLRAAASELEAVEGCDGSKAAVGLAAFADLAGLFGDADWGAAMPRGVVAVHGSATQSLATLVGAAAPALAFGNAVIAVPHPAATEAAERLAAALGAAGLPAGLFTVLPAGAGSWELVRRRPEVTVAVASG
jgi:betaine-aldehyde dehydrogenase